jgi:hypothetical protein
LQGREGLEQTGAFFDGGVTVEPDILIDADELDRMGLAPVRDEGALGLDRDRRLVGRHPDIGQRLPGDNGQGCGKRRHETFLRQSYMIIYTTPLIIKTPAGASTRKWEQTSGGGAWGTGGWVDIISPLVQRGPCEMSVIGDDRRGRGRSLLSTCCGESAGDVPGGWQGC